MKDGRLMAAVSKKDDVTIIGGMGGKKKGKKAKVTQPGEFKSFNIDFSLIGKFGLVKVSPPISPDDLEKKVEELTKKKDDLFNQGEEVLKKDQNELAKYIEKEVDADLARE